MQTGPDDMKWLPESRMLGLCHLPRSVLNSWKRANLDLTNEAGAYGLAETISVLLLGAARDHIQPHEMAEAWREIVATGAREEIIRKAREVEGCDRFDLIVDPENAVLTVATSDEELIEAVCHPTWPRATVVVDVLERVSAVVRAFHKRGSRMTPPTERKPGRPRNADRAKVVAMPQKRGSG